MDESKDLKPTNIYPGTAHKAFIKKMNENPEIPLKNFQEGMIFGKDVPLKDFQEFIDLNKPNYRKRINHLEKALIEKQGICLEKKNALLQADEIEKDVVRMVNDQEILDKVVREAEQAIQEQPKYWQKTSYLETALMEKKNALLQADEIEKDVVRRIKNQEILDKFEQAILEQPVLRPEAESDIPFEYKSPLFSAEEKKAILLDEEKVIQKCLDDPVPIIRCGTPGPGWFSQENQPCMNSGTSAFPNKSGDKPFEAVTDDMLVLSGLKRDGEKYTPNAFYKKEQPAPTVKDYFGTDEYNKPFDNCPVLSDTDGLLQKMEDIFGYETGTKKKTKPEIDFAGDTLKELNRLLDGKELTASYDDDFLTINSKHVKDGLRTKITTKDISKAYNGLTAIAGRDTAIRAVAKVLASKVNSLF